MRRKMLEGLRIAYFGIGAKEGETEDDKDLRIKEQEAKSHNVFLEFIFGHIVNWRNIKSAKGKDVELSLENFKLLAGACPTLADNLYDKITKISSACVGIKASLK
jgi:hypothetical protein